MNIGDLRMFEAVARLGAISRAAGELNTGQSNVTNRIKLLEHELKTMLFHRSFKGVTLTESGRRLLPYAIQIAQLLSDAKRVMARRDERGENCETSS